MEVFSVQPLLFFLLFLYLYLRFFRSTTKPIKNGFKVYPIVGTLPEFLKNRHRFLEWTTQVLGGCPTNTAVYVRPGRVCGVNTANPDNVEHMLKTRFENYPKGDQCISLLEDFLGRGIFNSDGDIWKVQRRTASHEFNTKSLRNFFMENISLDIQTKLFPILSKASETKRTLDLQDILQRFGFDNICKVAFNVDAGCLGSYGTKEAVFMQAFEDAAMISSEKFLIMHAFPLLWKIKKFFNVGIERKLRESIAIVHKFADEVIRSRMEARIQKREEDLLSRFIATEEISPHLLRDIIISFVLAGRDTTSSVLSWFFWILSCRPDVEQNVLEELKMIRIRNGKGIGDMFSFEELKEMHYLHAAISETMRLYPPLPINTKACLNDDVWPDGTTIKKGWFVSYHTYAMGRMEKFWGNDSNEFRPERWIDGDGNFKPESPFKFPVFHGGPRICLGKDMAYIQMKFIVASVLERYEIELEDKSWFPEQLLSITLRMKGGLPIKLKERCECVHERYE